MKLISTAIALNLAKRNFEKFKWSLYYQILGLDNESDQNCLSEEFRFKEKILPNQNQDYKDKIYSQTWSNNVIPNQDDISNLRLISDQFNYENTNEVLNCPNINNSFEPINFVENCKFNKKSILDILTSSQYVSRHFSIHYQIFVSYFSNLMLLYS